MTRIRRILIPALLGLLAVVPSAHAVEPGVVLGGAFFDSGPTYDAAAASGAKWVRMFLYRDQMELAPGVLNTPVLAAYQSSIDRYQARGLKTEVVVVGTPAWESGSTDHLVPPNPDRYAAFAKKLSSSLKGVSAYEVWNEADAQLWWRGAPDPAGYAALLKAAYPAFKSGNSGADVLVGGLTGNDYAFLDGLYDNGAKGSFDGVSVHTDTACGIASPYSFYKDPNGRISQYSFLGFKEIVKSMDAHGDTDKPVWFTEFGWSTTTAVCDQGMWAGQKAGGVSDDDQALYLKQAWHCMSLDPRVKAAFWFNLQDTGPADTADDRFGLVRTDFSHKPAYAALADVARNGDQLTEACGDFGGPTIQMLELGDTGVTGQYVKRLHVKVQATDPQIVGRITLLLDGRKLRNFTTGKATTMVASIDVDSAKNLPAGPHKLTVVARDMTGNESTQDFTVTKVSDTAKPAKKKPAKKKKRKKRK